jgi:hypothetical protein
MPLQRKDLETRYLIFQKFALEDQKSYYKSIAQHHRAAASQVNGLRATLALLTGLAAAAAALIVQAYFVPGAICYVNEANPTASFPWYCGVAQQLTGVFIIASITLPAFGAMFGTLADLYQWDRLIMIYKNALQNIEVADAQSPDTTIPDDLTYHAAYMAYAEGTLSVMNDETAQWGQGIRTPEQLEKFLIAAQVRVERTERSIQGKAADILNPKTDTSTPSNTETPPSPETPSSPG